MNVEPNECLYIGDSKSNIEIAKKLGFKICRLNSIEDLNKLVG